VLAILALASCTPSGPKQSAIPPAPSDQKAPSAPTVTPTAPTPETTPPPVATTETSAPSPAIPVTNEVAQTPTLPTTQPAVPTPPTIPTVNQLSPSISTGNGTAPTPTPATTVVTNPPQAGTTKTTPQSAPESANKSPATPSVSDRYKLPHVAFANSGLITTPGKVWVGSVNGMVDVFDAKSGQVLQSVALFKESGGMTQQRIYDLKFDGQHVWVLASSKMENKPDTLFVIDEANGTILKQFDASEWEGELDQKLGYSPGKIWASKQSIDTRTYKVSYDAVPWGNYYAYDGKGWMWITGNWYVSDCNPAIRISKADDPTQHYSAWSSDLNGNPCSMPIAVVLDRIWFALSGHSGNNIKGTALYAYPADGGKINKANHAPLIMVPSPDDQPITLVGDQDGLWMLAGGKKWGHLYRLDPKTGVILNDLDLVGADYKKTLTANIALDDHDLWVLMAKELLRIHLR